MTEHKLSEAEIKGNYIKIPESCLSEITRENEYVFITEGIVPFIFVGKMNRQEGYIQDLKIWYDCHPGARAGVVIDVFIINPNFLEISRTDKSGVDRGKTENIEFLSSEKLKYYNQKVKSELDLDFNPYADNIVSDNLVRDSIEKVLHLLSAGSKSSNDNDIIGNDARSENQEIIRVIEEEIKRFLNIDSSIHLSLRKLLFFLWIIKSFFSQSKRDKLWKSILCYVKTLVINRFLELPQTIHHIYFFCRFLDQYEFIDKHILTVADLYKHIKFNKLVDEVKKSPDMWIEFIKGAAILKKHNDFLKYIYMFGGPLKIHPLFYYYLYIKNPYIKNINEFISLLIDRGKYHDANGVVRLIEFSFLDVELDYLDGDWFENQKRIAVGISQSREREELKQIKSSLSFWIDRLFFPLASILQKYKSEIDVGKKINYLLHFFEATSQFIFTIFISRYFNKAPDGKISVSNLSRNCFADN
ncbi:MAG: hypothetical protein ACTSWN_16475 [Promethearchaeota archaeon]